MLAYCGRRTDNSPTQSLPYLAATLLAWDLAGGKAHEPVPIMRELGWSIVALDEQRVLVAGQVIDVRCRMPVARYSCHCLADSPDGRLWGLGPDPAEEGKPSEAWSKQPGQPWNPARDQKGAVRPVELVAMGTGPASPQDIFTPQTPLTVEVDYGKKAERNQTLGEHELALLQKKGYTFGKSQWRLRAEADDFDTQQFFTNREPLPGIRLTWRFITPEGTEAWKNTREIECGEALRKYAVGTKTVDKNGPFYKKTIIENYDFKGREPREVLIEDMLDQARYYPTVEAFPRQMGRFNGKYQELPALGEVRFPPMSQ